VSSPSRHPGIDEAKNSVAAAELALPELIALGDYAAPTMPTERALRVAWTRLKRRIAGPEDPLVQHPGLEQASLAVADDLADAPDCDPLLRALDQQFGEWSRGAGAHPGLRALIVPPCDTTGTLEVWARNRGHTLLPEPDRSHWIGPAAEAHLPMLPDLSGEGLLVIPRLEHWFLRQRNGLHALRLLLSRLACTERRCLVGCNSWAWRFVVKSAGADLALPRPQAFEPFDARQLRSWFVALADHGDGTTASFRLASDGADVLACDDDGDDDSDDNSDGEPRNAYLRQLAARSGGIPWVAWHLWRASLKVSGDEEPLSDRAAKATAGDARTVWVVDVDDIDLPPSNTDRALLVLQALLIHGALTPAEIDAVLPTTGDPDMLAALVASGHLRREGNSGRHRVRPTAYPAVRRALKAAGFPTGAM
jgi:hypothetical protein